MVSLAIEKNTQLGGQLISLTSAPSKRLDDETGKQVKNATNEAARRAKF